VLGHQADDQAETVLLRLLRGTGIAGLAAMAELGPGRLMRPMLSLRRRTILAYLAAIGGEYVVDSSNLAGAALRNRIRRTLLPLLERDYSPGLSRRLAELATEAREVNTVIAAEAGGELAVRTLGLGADTGPSTAPDKSLQPASPSEHPAIAAWRIGLRGFTSLSPAVGKAIMRELLGRSIGDLRHIGRRHIDAMHRLALADDPSAVATLPRGWRFRREYGNAVLEGPDRSAPAPFMITLVPGVNVIRGSGLTLRLTLLNAGAPGSAPALPGTSGLSEAWFDASGAPMLIARSLQTGDRIRPFGMRGSRKLQDVFVDRKIALVQRRLWPLVVSDGEILWIPGVVRSRHALVTAASKKIWHLHADFGGGESNLPLPQV